MADTKISSLAAVTDVLGTDEFVLARSGTTKKIDASDLATGLLASAPGAGSELAYTEITSDANITSTSSSSPDVLITAGAVSMDGSRSVLVQTYTAGLYSPGGAGSRFTALELFVAVDGGSATCLGIIADVFSSATSQIVVPSYTQTKLTPDSGSNVYSLRGYVNGGTGTVAAGTGGAGAFLPAYIRVVAA